MKTKLSLLSSALLGIIFGVTGALSWTSASSVLNQFFIWGIVGLLIGLFIEDKKFVTWAGIFYGFFVTFSFFILHFKSEYSDSLIHVLASTIVLSIIGAFCGWLLVFCSNWIKNKFR